MKTKPQILPHLFGRIQVLTEEASTHPTAAAGKGKLGAREMQHSHLEPDVHWYIGDCILRQKEKVEGLSLFWVFSEYFDNVGRYWKVVIPENFKSRMKTAS